MEYPTFQQDRPVVRAEAVTPAADGPLTPEHHRQWVLAGERAKAIRRAAGVARFNGWVTGILAACSAPFILFGMTNLLVTFGLSVVAYNEFRGRKRLLEFDPSAPALLGWNQVGLLAMIALYCLWMLYSSLTGMDRTIDDARAMLGVTSELDPRALKELVRLGVFLVYGLVIVLSAVFQGLNALYYFTRRRHIEAYLRETPQWVVKLQRFTPPG